MNRLLKRWVGLLPLVVGIAGFTYFTWPKEVPPDNFWCALQPKKDNRPRLFGKLREQIAVVRITGLATKTKVDALYDFKGRASLSTATKSVQGSVQGDVFADKTGRPSGLLLWVNSGALGSDELEVTTLNRDGMLDFSQSEAFLHIGPNLGASDRLSYPVAMSCRAKLPE